MTGAAQRQQVLDHARRWIGRVSARIPPSETSGLLTEFSNRMEAFSLFEHADRALGVEPDATVFLRDLAARAAALGPYRSVWAKEGTGYLYARSEWHYSGEPRGMLAPAELEGLPDGLNAPFHVGMGMVFAERLLAGRGVADLDVTAGRFVHLCYANSAPGWEFVAIEPLGFVTRALYPGHLHDTARILRTSYPATLDYFWHGVGRALYFSPGTAMPVAGAHARALRWAVDALEEPGASANAVAGWIWALTLVNIRHPALIEAAFARAVDTSPRFDALRQGIAAALTVWSRIEPECPYVPALAAHQPQTRIARRLWAEVVRPACLASRLPKPVPPLFRYSR